MKSYRGRGQLASRCRVRVRASAAPLKSRYRSGWLVLLFSCVGPTLVPTVDGWFPESVGFYSVTGKFSFSLNPLGSKVFSLEIQKSSLWSNKLRIWSFVRFFFVTSSITIRRKSRLKLWSCWLKCWSMDKESGLGTSFLCLLARLFIPWASTFPTYCFWLHFRQKPR